MELPTKEEMEKAKAEVEVIHKWHDWQIQTARKADVVMFIVVFVVSIIIVVVKWPWH